MINHPITNYTRFWLQWRSRLICVSAAMLICVLSANAQTDAPFQPIGGGGGGPFVGRCPQGQLLTGFELRVGEWIDAIRPICVTAYGPADIGSLVPLGESFGGSGGGIEQLICPRGAPIVTGMYVRAWGEETLTVESIGLFCGAAATTQTPKESYDVLHGYPEGRVRVLSKEPKTAVGTQRCPTSLVAVGINGRNGIWLDAVGLICGVPTLAPDDRRSAAQRRSEVTTPEGVKPQGRVKLGAPTGPLRAICDLAREARARNSPAAPGLEESCRVAGAAGEIPPVKAQGRVKLDPTVAPTSPSRPICDVAREARARNSPAAPGLEESCRADLAAKGLAIAQMDPKVAAARTAESDNLYRQGFDIATGIFGDPALGAWGRTATGPGSLGIRGWLTPAGQRGFNASVTFHLNRKYAQASVQGVPTITANANPVVVPNGQASGTTTITWQAAPDYTYCEIYLSINNGEWSQFASGGDGSKTTTIEPGSSQTFRMMVYQGQAGTPKIVATLTVTARN